MKPRYVDFLTESEVRALSANRDDLRLYTVGLFCLVAMMAISIGFVTL